MADTSPTPPSKPSRGGGSGNLLKAAAVVLVLSIAGGFAFGWLQSRNTAEHGKSKKEHAVPVVVARARIQQLPLQIKSIGNVMAYSVVNILPQVNGQLAKVYFNQGDMVRKGQPLFEIDPSPYQASLEQAEGNVARDTAQIHTAEATMAKDQATVGQLEASLRKDLAQLKFARAEYTRYTMLVAQGAVSHEQSDQMATNQAAAEATIESDKKAIENAKSVVAGDVAAIETARGTLHADQAASHTARIQLGWTTIKSPIDGRTSSLNIYQGNVVNSANASMPLVSIAQVQPIYISFTLPEQYLDQIRRCMANRTLKVQALIEGVKEDISEGTVSFLENSVNTTSGTVALRATFANTNVHLYPGQFVDIIVTMPPEGDTVVVPAVAIQTSQQGNAVYIVKPDNTVAFKPVELRRTYGDWAAVGSGVDVGDLVVTDGQLQLIPGAKVRIARTEGEGENGFHHRRHADNVGGPPSDDNQGDGTQQ